jgi:hypothetical protein
MFEFGAVAILVALVIWILQIDEVRVKVRRRKPPLR